MGIATVRTFNQLWMMRERI